MGSRHFLLIGVLMLMLSFPVAGQQYYADITISVKQNGMSTVSGITNHPALSVNRTQEWTSQEGRYWLLNVTVPGKFSDFVYQLKLPPTAKVNYINTPTITRIEDTAEGITLVGTGDNSSFYIVAQYSLGDKTTENSTWQIPVYVLSGAVLALAGVYFIAGRRRRRSRKRNFGTLSERQQLIMKTIEKFKKPMTQGEIQRRTQLPKASLSRNIEALVGRGLLKKEVQGMSNIVYLNEDVPERSGEFRQK